MKTCTTCGAEWPDDTKFCPSDGSALKVAGGGEANLVGGVLQSYHIIKKLGEGGMGAVYLGEHVKMGRKSAIKVMTQSLANDTDAIARFNREAANAASINHVNVCAIYDFGETTEGTIFLAMEYIEGEALTDLIKREGPLDLERAGTILAQTGDALQAAHELGIVHRDLKPDNIMIAKARDGSDLVKVVDFGIAKAMGGEEGQNVTRTGLVVGTPEYMSPEQLSGDKLDGRSDVYSLALVFFRMITGTLPFKADSAQEVMIKRLTDDPVRLNEALEGANFSPKLQLVMDRAMERMPSDRYPSADEFAREASTSIADAPTTTSPQPIDTQGATQLLDTGPSDPDVTEELKKTRLSEAPATIAMSDITDADVTTASSSIAGDGDVSDRTTPDTPKPRQLPDVGAQKKKTPFVAIAASVVVIGIGGGVAAVAFGGGGDSNLDNDSTQVALGTPPDSGEGIDTLGSGEAVATPGGEQGQVGATDSDPNAANPLVDDPPPGENNDPTETGTTTTAVDLEGLAAELVRLGQQIVPDSTERVRTAARVRLQAIYDMPAVPDTLRARTASIVAESFEDENMADACTWIDRAINLQPNNPNFSNYKEYILECNL